MKIHPRRLVWPAIRVGREPKWPLRMLCSLLLTMCLIGFGACSQPGPPPNILIILVDTLRADRLGVYGNQRGLTPFLDQLASQGTVFENAYAPSSWTCPSVASLFSSRFASQHGVNGFDARLADQEITLAELLAGAGYQSAGFSANLRMLAANGYAQGFAQWQAFMGSAETGGLKPRGDILRRESLAWIRSFGDAAKAPPRMLYLQYMEPHTPYQPAEPFRSKFRRGSPSIDDATAQRKLMYQTKALSAPEVERLESLYDGEVAAVDEEIRKLFAELEPTGFLDHAVIVITADHGEEFGEHGVMLHGFTLYNGAMRVPLVIVAPGFHGGRVVKDNVSLVDVAPTLLELAGLPAPNTFEGRSLVPFMRNPFAPAAMWARLFPAPDVIGEIEPYTQGGEDFRKHSQALVSGPHKLLVTPKGDKQLFDLHEDPVEAEPLNGDRAASLYTRLSGLRAELQAHAVETTQGHPIDDATREKLRALGYQP